MTHDSGAHDIRDLVDFAGQLDGSMKIMPKGEALLPQWVRGKCPACGNTNTLFVGMGGYLTCSWITCPNPAAASEALHA